MGGKQSIPQANEAFIGRMYKFPSLSEDILTKQELEEGVVILDTLRSYGSTSRASFMEIENNDNSTRFMMARAEADRIAEAESLRLATEQSIRVNDEGSLIYQGSIRSILSRKNSSISNQLSRSSTILTKQSTKDMHLDDSAENLDHISSTINNGDYYNSTNQAENIGSTPQFFEILSNKCGATFSDCQKYPKSEAERIKRNINNCDSELVVNQTVETCGCLGPRHDRLNCQICRGMHLEDAPLLY